MKVPPKRKGNKKRSTPVWWVARALNESPSEKEGKWGSSAVSSGLALSLNESPSEKEGKYNPGVHIHLTQIPQ